MKNINKIHVGNDNQNAFSLYITSDNIQVEKYNEKMLNKAFGIINFIRRPLIRLGIFQSS